MGSLDPRELSLDSRFSSETIRYFVAQVSKIESESDKISKLEDYAVRLRDEMKKIDAFKRELPLCFHLLNDAYVRMNEELAQCKEPIAEPVLEEFIPLKKSTDDENDESNNNNNKENDIGDKKNWMSSVQLWNSDNQNHHHPNTDLTNVKPAFKLESINKKRTEDEVKLPMLDNLFQTNGNRIVGRAFVPFPVRKEDRELPGVTGLSLQTPEIKNLEDVINNSNGIISKSISSRSGSYSATYGLSQTARKQRRCWSPELHRRFTNALDQLGGAQAATPKQIRELMQVDGLTNDEVKSHLQKYRLHERKSPSTTNTSNVQPLGLGSLWASQEHCNDSSKPSTSQSGSPPGPLHLNGSSRGTSMTGGDSMEDEEDEKTESHSWKSHIYLSGRENV